MFKTPNEPGLRVPLSNEEYQGLRTLFGFISSCSVFHDRLKGRLQYCKGWKWFRLAETAMSKAVDNLLTTVPRNKLVSINKDLDHVKIEVYVSGAAGGKNHDEFFYVHEDVMNKIAEYACANECQWCTKTGAAAKQCQLRKALIGIIPWDLKTLDEDGHCRLSGETSIGMSEEELPQCKTTEDMEEEWSE